MARLSDRGYRRTSLTGSVLVWSLVTSATGLCMTGAQLFFARFGVGIGEAGALPASHALIADTYPASKRSTALAFFTVGGPIGMLIAFGAGGWLNVHIGWRATFGLVGATGLLLALALRFCLPPDTLQSPAQRSSAKLDLVVIRRLTSDRAFLHLLIGISLSVLLLFGQTQWISPFFERSFPSHHATLGPTLAYTRMAAMVVGLLVGGLASDRFSREPILFMAIAYGLGFIPQVASYCVAELWEALALSSIAGFAISLAGAPSAASILNLAPASMRATASALSLMTSAIIGMGGGPLLIGYASDLLTPYFGDQALRYALILFNLVFTPWMLLHLVLAARSVRGRLPADIAAKDVVV